jgi:hypothetical protein
VFRRYAAKLLVEYDMFQKEDFENGERYGKWLRQGTGFIYQPECHLLDLAPEFYCLDYVLAWMAVPLMERYLVDQCGGEWIYSKTTGRILKRWWRDGNRYDIFSFMERNDLGNLNMEPLVTRWLQIVDEAGDLFQ